jgi:hypothetical protein
MPPSKEHRKHSDSKGVLEILQAIEQVQDQQQQGQSTTTPTWLAVQEKLGNRRVTAILSGQSIDPFDLYVRHLLQVEREQGLDTSLYLPWNAPPAWTEWIRPYYGVLSEHYTAQIENGEPGIDSAITPAPGPELLSQDGLEKLATEDAFLVDWFNATLHRAGSGRSAKPQERALMEQVHGPLPDTLKIHEGAAAQEAAEGVQAKAFTLGTNIYFSGNVNANNAEGAELLVHEATHVKQAVEGRLPTKKGDGLETSSPSDPHELEAYAAGERGRDLVTKKASWNLDTRGEMDPAGEAILNRLGMALPDIETWRNARQDGASKNIAVDEASSSESSLLSRDGDTPKLGMGNSAKNSDGSTVGYSVGTDGGKVAWEKELVDGDKWNLNIPIYGAAGAGIWAAVEPSIKLFGEGSVDADKSEIKGGMAGEITLALKGGLDAGMSGAEGSAYIYGAASLAVEINGLTIQRDHDGTYSLGLFQGAAKAALKTGVVATIEVGPWEYGKKFEWVIGEAELLTFQGGGWEEGKGASGFDMDWGSDIKPTIDWLAEVWEDMEELFGLDSGQEEKAAAIDAEHGSEDLHGECPVQGRDLEERGWTARAIAAEGVKGAGSSLPHLRRIQLSFGQHDVSDVRAHIGGNGTSAVDALNAKAYATGDDVAFGAGAADLHTTAHEAAHVVQQRSGKVPDGVGSPNDRFEKHADAVADKVVAGESAEGLLSEMAGSGGGTGIQKKAVQKDEGIDPDQDQDESSEEANEPGLLERIASTARLYLQKKGLNLEMVNPDWIIEAAVATVDQIHPHPKHARILYAEIFTKGVLVSLETSEFRDQIDRCEDDEDLDDLRVRFELWQTNRVETLQADIEALIEKYREAERSWLTAFSSTLVGPQSVHPNKSDKEVDLSIKGGSPISLVTVETRVNCIYDLTTAAQGNSVPDWTDVEKAHFMSRFQQQIDLIWSTSSADVAPFACVAPEDHLLDKDLNRWSDIVANLKAKVTEDSANPHFVLNVSKEDSSESNRAHVGTGTGHFYLKNANAGFDASGNADGSQPTLAHEWHHMIGNPDEYAENSKSQSASALDTSSSWPPRQRADYQNNWSDCETHFTDIINDPTASPADIAQAQSDLAAVRNPWTDTSTDPGFQGGIYNMSDPDSAPDECFAFRGAYDSSEASHHELRPGGQAGRGGHSISDSAEDAARLSDGGTNVLPYMREGLVEELSAMLEGVFDPEVRFDHNFEQMSNEMEQQTLKVRLQNIAYDEIVLSSGSAPASETVNDDHNHEH